MKTGSKNLVAVNSKTILCVDGRAVSIPDLAARARIDARYLSRCLSRSGKVPYALARKLETLGVRMETSLKIQEGGLPEPKTAAHIRAEKDAARRNKALQGRAGTRGAQCE